MIPLNSLVDNRENIPNWPPFESFQKITDFHKIQNKNFKEEQFILSLKNQFENLREKFNTTISQLEKKLISIFSQQQQELYQSSEFLQQHINSLFQLEKLKAISTELFQNKSSISQANEQLKEYQKIISDNQKYNEIIENFELILQQAGRYKIKQQQAESWFQKQPVQNQLDQLGKLSQNIDYSDLQFWQNNFLQKDPLLKYSKSNFGFNLSTFADSNSVAKCLNQNNYEEFFFKSENYAQQIFSEPFLDSNEIILKIKLKGDLKYFSIGITPFERRNENYFCDLPGIWIGSQGLQTGGKLSLIGQTEFNEYCGQNLKITLIVYINVQKKQFFLMNEQKQFFYHLTNENNKFDQQFKKWCFGFSTYQKNINLQVKLALKL